MAETEHALVRRAAATQATRDEWWERPHRYGLADCVRMTASHVRRLGHQVKLPPEGSYRGERTATLKLQARGWNSLAEAMDAHGFERIPPAAALVGDVIEMPGEPGGFTALTIALGNGRVLGWHPDAPKGACVMQPEQTLAAWRIDPKD
jgi:hypothetical protein